MSASNGKPRKNGATLDRTDLDALKARVDLVELVRQSGVELKKAGKNWLGRCPFHEDSTPSLSVNAQAQLFNCLGCQTGGDALRWVQLKENVEFPEALKRLQQWAGAHPESPPKPKKSSPPPSAAGPRWDLLARVAQHYREALPKNPQALAYLERRGLTSTELGEAFQLGYADGSLLRAVPDEGEVRQALAELGVLTATGKELLRGCLVVPLTHPDFGTVGLYGRKLDDQAAVKHLYLTGPKRGCLNWQALQISREVWLTESVLDALSLWQAGCRDVTCLFGVQGLPVDLEQLLGRYAVAEVRLCLDADRAGQEATLRLARTLQEKGVRCRQVGLPAGTDPNQLLCERGPQFLAERARAHEPLEERKPAAEPQPTCEPAPDLEHSEEGFVWRVGELTYKVVPRLPFEGKLQVRLEVERGTRRFRDTFNLDAHRSRALAIQQIAARLEVSRGLLETHFLRLIDETERWHEAGQEKILPAAEDPAAMSDAEREEALAFLRRPDLVDTLLKDTLTLGYVGEERSKLLAYLIGVSRKLPRPLAGIIKSQSGAGKSSLTEMVELLTPPEDVEFFSKLTPQALYWMARTHLKHKLLVIEERAGSEQADYPIRVLQSRRCLTMAAPVKNPITGKMETQTFVVEGPIAYLETTTSHRINHENATRCFELTLDESEEQTSRIHARQRRTRSLLGLAQASGSEAIMRRRHCAQRLLEPLAVMIPYVDLLRFPARWLRTRRDHERFLCLIEGVAFLHQHQRTRGTLADGTPYIEAAPYDYRVAFHLAREVLAATFQEMSRDARELLELLSQLLANPEAIFTRRDLRTSTLWQDHRLRGALDELVDFEHLETVSGSKGKTFQYRLVGPVEAPAELVSRRDLTPPEELERRWPPR